MDEFPKIRTRKKKEYKQTLDERRNAADFLFLNKSDSLSRWELGFVENIRESDYPLSSKQKKILNELWKKYTGSKFLHSAWDP